MESSQLREDDNNLIFDPLLGAMQPPPPPTQILFENENFDEDLFPNHFIDNIQDEEVEFEHVLKDTLRYVAGFKKGRKSGKFTSEGQILMGKANLLFANKDYDEAVIKIKHCIQFCPNTQQPWYLLGLIYQELGNELKAMQTFFIAAHFDMKNTQLWLRLANLSKQQNKLKEAVYCTTKAIQSSPSTDLYFMRSSLFLQINMPFKCAKDYLEIVKLNKHSISLMMEAVNVFLSRSRFDLISQILLHVFEGFRLLITDKIEIKNVPADRPFTPLNYIHVDLLFESLLCQKLYKEALISTKSAILVLYHFLNNAHAESNLLKSVEDVDPQDLQFNEQLLTMKPIAGMSNLDAGCLPLTWRTYIGICRSFMRQLDVAKSHFAYLFSSFNPANTLLYDQIFSILIECQYYTTCIEYIDLVMSQVNNDFKWTLYYHKAVSCTQLQDFESALNYFSLIIQNEGDYCNESRIQIAQLQTQLNLNPLEVWRDVKTTIPNNLRIHLNSITLENSRLDTTELQSYMDIIKSKCRVLRSELLKLQASQASHENCESGDISIQIKSLAVECSEAYSSWFELFLKTTAFYCKDRSKKFVGIFNDKMHYADIDNSHLHTDGDLDFIYLNCTFKEWFAMILNLIKSLVLADNVLEAINVIKKCISSNLFVNLNRKYCMLILQCSLYKRLHMYEESIDSIRLIISNEPYNINTYHVFMQLIQHDTIGISTISNSNCTRCFKRHLNKFDSVVEVSSNNIIDCKTATLIINAYTLMNSRSVQPSITYLMRCVVMKPENALLNLLVGVSWITRGMNRSTEDRHLNITTGIGYLLKYYKIEKRRYYQQACYNMARAFHQIGLYDHAVDYYLKCICKNVDGSFKRALKQTTVNELDKLAAYNMSLILKSSRSLGLANALLNHIIKI
eukprot:NODE_270_length_12222_cov_0.321868.p2 type:complete len:905 gc:universal NODE_270_length_12222_cov_0.321868:3031-5745(+)